MVKALSKDNPSFKFLQCKFTAESDAKLGAGAFNGPQIRELMRNCSFDEVLSEAEKKSMGILQKCINRISSEKA